MKKYERSLQIGLVRNSDIGKEMTLRNASEHRRLAGDLKDLDSQLHNKLVSMQAEITELKTSLYGSKRNTSYRLGVSRERANSDFGLRALTPIPRTLTSARSLGNLHERQTKSLVFPDINVQKTSLVGNSSCATTSPRENHPKKDFKQFLEPPNGLSSVHRPSSLPDLRGAENSRFSSRTTSKTLLNLDSHLEQCSLPSEMHLSSLTKDRYDSIEDFDDKTQDTTQDITNESLIVPAIEYLSADNNNHFPQSSEDPSSIFINSLLAKATFSDNDPQIKQDLASRGFKDFNDVIDKRLSLCKEETPSKDEMRKVRYLRWRKEEDIDLVDVVF